MARRRETTGWRSWRMTQRASAIDRTNLMVGVALILLLVVLIVPRVYPAAQHGITCTDLAAPLGGNNRSILAQAGDDSQNLDLLVELEKDPVLLNEQLVVYVTFVNNDTGPVILYLDPAPAAAPQIMRPDLAATNPDNARPGLVFEIRAENASWNPLNYDIASTTSTSLQPELLHLLGSRSRCTMKYIINPSQAGSLPAGTYRIRAHYRNSNVGVLPAPGAGAPTPTATPAYTDQGVWTGRASSEEVLFTISTTSATAPP